MGWFNQNLFSQETAQALAGMFLKRGNPADNVRPGVSFQRIHPDEMVETAKVISVDTDAYGIPHVHYLITFQRPNRSIFDEGQRMLALQSFADRYKEMVPA